MKKSFKRVCISMILFLSFSISSLSSQEALTIQPDGSILILIDGEPQLLTDYLVPVGTVQAYMGDEAPSGWLLCDGSSYNTTEYARLFAVLQYNHGGSDTTFNVPDLRGLFLRGTDNEAGVDPDAADRTSPVDGSVVGDVVGSLQPDEIVAHGHSRSLIIDTTPSTAVFEAPIAADPLNQGVGPSGQTGLTGGSETRPKNMSVNYIIKY